MARYKLTMPHYLGTRYFAEGSIVDWDGPPSKKGMVSLDKQNRPVDDNSAKQPEVGEASEVPQPGGEPPDPTWAPQARPAFATKTLRKPDPNDPDKQASITRVAASPPSAGAASGDPGKTTAAATPTPTDDKAKGAAYAKAQSDERAADRGTAAQKAANKTDKD